MGIVARDVMKSEIVSVAPTTPVTHLEDTLIGRHISGAPVIEGGRLVGIVSRSDIVRYFAIQRSMQELLGHKKASESARNHEADAHLTVRDIMAEALVTVSPDTPVEEVAHKMVDRHVHRVLVTEGDKVVGLISALDLARLIAERAVLVAPEPS
jgi:CBS domain-containing protein